MPLTSDWTRLLSPARASGGDPGAGGRSRSAWQRDFDRIVYSPSFRRLAGKTQVFPLPLDDHVHSRLTHSLEVATVGRSLGTAVGWRLRDRHALAHELEPRDLGDCVAAASLAHDLGNPPFGHVGEQAIREYFERHRDAGWFAGLAPRERLDLLRFEGNAQGLRLATRVARPGSPHGLDLTFATLGALVKYPCASDATERAGAASRRKHGVHAAEDAAFARAAEAAGLAPCAGARAWVRHPLAFLTEAADDIAYSVIDLEDGLRLGKVGAAQFFELLSPLADGPAQAAAAAPAGADRDALLERAGRLRTVAVGRFVDETVEAFVERLDALLDGSFDEPLVRVIPSAAALERIRVTDAELCYRDRDVLKMELSGAVAIQGVLDALVQGLAAPGTLRAEKLAGLLPSVLADAPRYQQLLRITDHVSGMTDAYVIRLYRELSGIRLPGGRD